MVEAAQGPPADQEAFARRKFVQALASGDLPQVCSAARQLLAVTQSTIRTTKFIRAQAAARPRSGLEPLRVALLSSFSIEPIIDPLWVYGLSEGLDVRIHYPGFDLYQQELRDPDSALHRGDIDALILAVEGERWAPGLYQRYLAEGRRDGEAVVDAVLEEISSLLHNFREHSDAPILFHALLPPRYPALGLRDAFEERGQASLIARVNQGLIDLAGDIENFFPIDVEAVVREVGYRHWYDPRLFFLARSAVARAAMDDLARLYMRYLRALTGRSRKCLVLDLDNTLWGGVLGEDGPLGIELGSEYPGNAFLAFQRMILTLCQRGVLLAIASKNNPEDVEELFRRNENMALKAKDFAAVEVHWEPKSRSLERIARDLNLGLEHLVLVDDDPVECGQVAAALPQVTTISLPSQPERYIDALLRDGLFDTLSLTEEDLRRADLYAQRAAGEQFRQSAASLEDYLRGLEITVYLGPVTDASVARAAQLSRKTNQFNTTTKRHTEAVIAKRIGAPDWWTLTARVTDRFGDNGIVGLAMAQLHGQSLEIETFLLSCRVIGRGIETALLHHLSRLAREAGADALTGRIIQTKRNAPVRDVYARHGFREMESGGVGGVAWRYSQSSGTIPAPSWLRIVDETGE